jgi:Kef-type K+ transport system membrane component KefB/mannitol/fructose-specific phosphotransferase system IIA component (Ntr-type)
LNLLLLAAPTAALDATEVTRLLLALAVLLGTARALGELARRFSQPSVLGELLAGILLGPALVGRYLPDIGGFLFPTSGPTATVLSGIGTLSVTLFLLVAGLEVDLSRIFKQGRSASIVGFMGIAAPFVIGYAAATYVPSLVGYEAKAPREVFTLFVATALSISALPVIAKTLMDLYLYRSDFGMIVIASAVFNDLVGWMIFAVILGMMGDPAHAHGIGTVIALTIGFALAMLTIGRWIIHRTLPWVQAHMAWPAGVIVFAITIALLSASFTEWVGIHAIFGAFLAGVALGDSTHLRERTRTTITEFVNSFFAPLFFAMIGLRVDFVSQFDFPIVTTMILIACVGKILGCGVGARLAGMPLRESIGIGLAMNARGSMEIILGLTALQYGVIGERLFVALVAMALVTSMMSGPLIQRVLKRTRPRRFARMLTAKSFVNALQAHDKRGAIVELSAALGRSAELDPKMIETAVLAREEIGTTGVGDGVAVPHARIEGLERPLLAFGISQRGIDFGAPDATPCKLVFLILTPKSDSGAQLEILSDLGRTLKQRELREKLLGVGNYTELLALLRADLAAR